jgi:hypothetical protein
MNKPLLRKVAKRIKEHPETYNQHEWCGTQCCIAGNAVWVHDGNLSNLRTSSTRAKKVLKISYEQAENLFYSGNWPEPFKTKFLDAETQEDEAQVAHDRIMHLIKTGE